MSFYIVICALLRYDMPSFVIYMQAYPLSGIMRFRQLIIAYVCRWDNFYRKCSMLVSSKISKTAVWSQPKSGRRGMRIHENIFCRNSSLVTFLSICLIIKWLECDELKSRLVTDNHVWRFKIATRHTLNHWLSVCYV